MKVSDRTLNVSGIELALPLTVKFPEKVLTAVMLSPQALWDHFYPHGPSPCPAAAAAKPTGPSVCFHLTSSSKGSPLSQCPLDLGTSSLLPQWLLFSVSCVRSMLECRGVSLWALTSDQLWTLSVSLHGCEKWSTSDGAELFLGYCFRSFLRCLRTPPSSQLPVSHIFVLMFAQWTSPPVSELHLSLQPVSDTDSTVLCKQRKIKCFTKVNENVNQHSVQKLCPFWPRAAFSSWGVVNGSWNQLCSRSQIFVKW